MVRRLQVVRDQRLQLQPQTSLRTQDELGETTNFPGAGPEFGVHPQGQTKPEQGQRHDHSKLCQGEFLPNTVPVENKQVPVFTSASLIVWFTYEDAVPGAWGEGDEGMRSPPLCPCRVKTQRIKLLKESKSLRSNTTKVERRLRSFFFISYIWVRPDGRVVVRSINTDQTDGTLGRTTQRPVEVGAVCALK